MDITRVLLVEDDPQQRKLILDSFSKILPVVEVVVLEKITDLDEMLQTTLFNYAFVDGDLYKYFEDIVRQRVWGEEIVARIKKAKPDIKVVAISTQSALNDLMKRKGAIYVVPKIINDDSAVAEGFKKIIEGGAGQ